MEKRYTISIPVKTFWTRIVPVALVLLVVGGITGIILIDRLVMPRLVGIRNKGIVSVPAIEGLSYEEARRALYGIGLRLQVQEREYSTEAPEGAVLSQRPDADELVKKGRHVHVILSKGDEVGNVPNVGAMSEHAARRKLRDAGFSNVEIRKIYDEEVPKDAVVGTQPASGTATSREITVELSVSRGPKPTHVEMPNLVGEMLSEARVALADAGLSTGQIHYRKTTTSSPGRIISQSLPPGASVPLESTVDLVISASR